MALETATTIIADPSVGLENIFNGIVPATAMELRARPDSDDKSRETTWTSWIAETTLTADYSGGGFLLGSASDIESTPAGGLSATNVQAALNELEAVMIDGWMPAAIRADLTRRTHAALMRLDLSGVEPPQVREGTVGADARALGAAAIPLAQRYLIDPNALTREG